MSTRRGVFGEIKDRLLGRPLRSDQISREKFGAFWGMPKISSDGVSSVAYTIEEILLILIPALSVSAFSGTMFIVLSVLILLGILMFSYSQIISHFPDGGGAYVVVRNNFGVKSSLMAASTLTVTYIMTVTVSVTSAAQAITSAFPGLEPYRVIICVCGIALLTLLNLRGTGEAAKIFGVPTYVFISLVLIMLAIGFVRLLTGGIAPMVTFSSDAIPVMGGAPLSVTGGMSLILLLRAFSSGCSGLSTGAEAVSEDVRQFKEPSRRNAVKMLCLLLITVTLVFGGAAFLVTRLRIPPVVPTPYASSYETLLSRLAHYVFSDLGVPGHILYFALQAFTILVLLLAANTAYSGLPSLLAKLGRDSYMPRHFAHRGAKLSFSNGILFIWLAASLLVIAFNADTHRVIPIYASGVFLTFTVSQTGMLAFWLRSREKHWQRNAAVNALGILITATGGCTALITRFTSGAWLLFAALPLLMLLMYGIHRHYAMLSQEITQEEFSAHYHRSESQSAAPMVVLLAGITRSSLKLLNYANSISHNVRALCISEDEKVADSLRQHWREWGIDVPLDIISAPFRDIILPMEEYLETSLARLEQGQTLTVLLTRVVYSRWYSIFLHNQTTYFISRRLSEFRRVATVLVPYIYD